MIDLLYEIKKMKEKRIRAGFTHMEPDTIVEYEAKYRTVLDLGLAENTPPPPPIKKRRGESSRARRRIS